jgi:hypothetical protein
VGARDNERALEGIRLATLSRPHIEIPYTRRESKKPIRTKKEAIVHRVESGIHILFLMAAGSVRRFVGKLEGSRVLEACPVIETAPGEETQVDYGEGPMVRDAQSAKYRRTRPFVLTLGYSRKSVRLLVFSSGSQVWAELHEKAFRRLGGATKIVVLDFVPRNKIQLLWRLGLCGLLLAGTARNGRVRR